MRTTALSLTQPRTFADAGVAEYFGESSVFGNSPLTALTTSFFRAPRALSLAFRKVTIGYQPQGKDGTAQGGEKTASWDVGLNKK